MRLPMTLRSNMVPYIYTHAALRSYTAGEALLTPTYYDPAAATADEAYAPEYGRQYLFGRQMLVAPVAYKVGGGPPQSPPENDTTWDAKDTRTASRSVWLTKGDWQAWSAAKGLPDALTPIHGPVVVTAEYGLNDIPVFVRAGAVIPTRTMSSAYHTTADPLVWQLAAPRGVGTGEGLVFEDDGESLEFRESTPSGATTSLTYTSAHEARLEATVGATNGSFTGMASVRAQWLVLYGQADEPKSATCDGAPLKPSSAGLGPGWWVAQPSAGHAGHPVHSKVGAARAAPATDDHEIIVYVPSLVVACDSAPTSVARTIKLAW
jgi:alpha-glucosidase (family GH31 glycosyl hydrolase)